MLRLGGLSHNAQRRTDGRSTNQRDNHFLWLTLDALPLECVSNCLGAHTCVYPSP